MFDGDTWMSENERIKFVMADENAMYWELWGIWRVVCVVGTRWIWFGLPSTSTAGFALNTKGPHLNTLLISFVLFCFLLVPFHDSKTTVSPISSNL